MKKICFLVFAFFAAATFAATSVTVDSLSRDASTGTLTVGYTLSGDSAVVTFGAKTNSVALPDAAFRRAAGDVNKIVSAGSHTLTWCPDDTFPGGSYAAGTFEAVVKAWPTNSPPDYLVIDLVNKVARYYPCVDVLPGGVRDRRYVTDQIVFRRIPAAGVVWRMGSPTDETGRNAAEATRYVKLTEDYYLAVFETTCRQAKHLFDATCSLWANNDYGEASKETDVLPYCRFSYNSLRGNPKSGYAYWPKDGHEITYADAGFKKARDKYGFQFDYPTEAQWEFACRAGEAAAFNNGKSLQSNPYEPQIDAIAWHYGNAKIDSVGYAFPRRPGLLDPNKYGLYDMLGNMAEFCLDGYASFTQDASDPTKVVEDPAGAELDLTATYIYRSVRGGGYSCKASDCRSSSRFGQVMGWDASTAYYNVGIPSSGKYYILANSFIGVRICLPAEAK